MSNKISEQYFDHKDGFITGADLLAKIEKETGFKSKEIVRTRSIYDVDKTHSVTYRGTYESKPAWLKLDSLQPQVDEVDIISKFNEQNDSNLVRLPKIFSSKKWDAKNGYGYILTESLDYPAIYKGSLVSNDEINSFAAFYGEYKANCFNTDFLKKDPDEDNALVFTMRRIGNWSEIADHKGILTEEKVKLLDRYYKIATTNLPDIKMQLMHGHLNSEDVLLTPDKEYILTSNFLISYRPEWYDATFHLWFGVKYIRDLSMTSDDVIKYLEKWISAYANLDVVKKDSDFEKKFAMQMLERCVGAILIDIENQEDDDKPRVVNFLSEIFYNLFDYFESKL